MLRGEFTKQRSTNKSPMQKLSFWTTGISHYVFSSVWSMTFKFMPFSCNIHGVLNGSASKFGIGPKKILPLDGRPEHNQRFTQTYLGPILRTLLITSEMIWKIPDLLILITDLWLIWFLKRICRFDENIWIKFKIIVRSSVPRKRADVSILETTDQQRSDWLVPRQISGP